MLDHEIEIEKDGAKYIMKDHKYYAYYQFGLQRTGTTIIDRMIRDNFKFNKANDLTPHTVKPPNADLLTWKHELNVPKLLRPGLPVVLNHKNPYTWLESMMYRRGASNGGWQQTYGKVYETQNQWERNKTRVDIEENGTCFPDQMLRCYKHWFNTWLKYCDENKETTMLIKWEHLLYKDLREDIFNEMWQKFSWPEYQFPEYTWAMHSGSSLPMTNDRIAYYVKSVPTQLEQRFIDMVPKIMGENLMKRLGYPIL